MAVRVSTLPEGFTIQESSEPPAGFTINEGPPPGFTIDEEPREFRANFIDEVFGRQDPGNIAIGEGDPTSLERAEALPKDFTTGVLRVFKTIPVAIEDFAASASGRRTIKMPESTAKSMGLQGEQFREFTEPRVVQGPSELGKIIGQKKAREILGATEKSAQDLQGEFDVAIKSIKMSLPESIQEQRGKDIVLKDEEGNISGIDVNIDQLAGVMAESLAFGGGVLAVGRALGGSKTAFGAANSLLVSLDTLEETKNEARDKFLSEGFDPDTANALATEAAHKAVEIIGPVSFVTGRFGEGSAALAPGPAQGITRGAVAGALTELPEEVTQAAAPQLALGEPVVEEKLLTAAVLAPLTGVVHGAAVGGVQGASRVNERRRAIEAEVGRQMANLTAVEKALIRDTETLEQFEQAIERMAAENVPVSRYEEDNPDIAKLSDGLRPNRPNLGKIMRAQDGRLLDEKIGEDTLVEVLTSNVQAIQIQEQTARSALADEQFEVGLISQEEYGDIKEQTALRVREAQEALARERAYLDPLAGVVQEWVNTYNPGMKVYLGAGAIGEVDGTSKLGIGVEGHMISMGQGRYVLQLNPASFHSFGQRDVIDYAIDELQGLSGEPRQNKFFTEDIDVSAFETASVEVLSHEFGHALAVDMASRMDENSRNALYNAWRKDMMTLQNDETMSLRAASRLFQMPSGRGRTLGAKSNFQEFMMQPPEEGQLALDYTTFRDFVANVDKGKLDYVLSFDEWMANQFAKFAGSSPEARDPVSTFFSRVGELLRRFHQRFRDAWAPSSEYSTWIEAMATSVRKGRWNEEMQRASEERNMDALSDSVIMQANRLLSSPDLNLTPETRRSFQQDLDKYGSLVKWGYTLVQLGRLNPHIQHLQNYIAAVKQWWVDKSRWGDRADTRLKEWRALGKDQGQRLARYVLDVTQESSRLGRKLTQDELQRINRRPHNQLTDASLGVFRDMQGDFGAALDAVHQVLNASAARAFTGNPRGLDQELARIQEDMDKLRNRDYFPLSRFGNYTVRVFANEQQVVGDRVYNPGDTIIFETYDSVKQQRQRMGELRRQYPRQAVGGAVLDETTQTFAGMPQALVERMLAMDELQLTEDQRAIMKEISHEMSPAQSYKKHLLKRSGTLGFSLDSMRGYASYFMHFSNHIARMQNSQAMRDAIAGMSEDVIAIQNQGQDATKRAQMRNHLAKHNEYIMNPGNELANLRALGFLWYLGANIKSAFVNLTQVPLVTYPYLAARKAINSGPAGVRDAKALQQITKAYKDVSLSIMEGRGLNADEVTMVDTLKERGIIDESLAMDLAALAEGSTLQRVLPGAFGKTARAQRMIRDTSYYAAWLFQSAEKFNRRITAVAAYRMGRDNGLDHDQALEEAHLAVETTQFEYARWNRARFMQGKKGVIFLFWQYLQNALHFATHDPGAIRYLIMLGLASGLTGLPFMEDILDLLDKSATKLKQATGMKNPKVESRLVLREFIEGLGADPNLVLNGVASEYGLGPLHLFELAGIPVPNVDITGSLSMGELVPGLNLLTDTTADTNRLIVEGAKDVAGAALNIPIVMYQTANDKNPDNWKKIERVLPTALSNISKAIRRNVRGAETQTSGARLVDVDGELIEYDPGDPGQLVESIAQGMGFAPSRVNKAREVNHTAREFTAYYEGRRRMLMAQLDYVRQLEDKEGIADVKKAIRDYNQTVPHPSLRLNSASILRSLRQRQRARVREEKGLPRSRRNIPSTQDIRRSYDTDPAN